MRSTRKSSRQEILTPPTVSSESDYASSLTRTAVAQLCNSIGFTAAENPALQALTDIATRYLRSIAKAAADSANSAGRTQSNLADTVAAVTELSSVPGFAGAWRVTGSLLHSGAMKGLFRFCKYSEEIPFAKPLPGKTFSIGKGKSSRNVDSNGQFDAQSIQCYAGSGDRNEGSGDKWKHIPKWLPIMPVIEEEEEGKRKELWWEFCGESKGATKWEEKKTERRGVESRLPMKRGKVRFKIGNGVLGVCKRGGRGKRVLCENWIFDTRAELDTMVI